MLIEMTCLAGGVPLGFFLRKSRMAVTLTAKLLVWSVRVLLLLLGFAIGSDDFLISSLASIGAKGVLITLLALAGTMIGTKIINPFVESSLHRRKNDMETQA